MPDTKIAIVILALVVTSIYLYQTHLVSHEGLSSLSNAGSKLTMAETALLSHLTISLRQVSSNPITLAITVQNDNAVPITLLTWDSPLDPLALQLGVLSITPSGSSTSLDIPTIKVSRKMPPGEDSLVEIPAGQVSKENVIVLKEMLVGNQLREMQVKKVSVECKGTWRAVWAASRGELQAENIERMGTDEGAVSGEFQSEVFDVMVE